MTRGRRLSVSAAAIVALAAPSAHAVATSGSRSAGSLTEHTYTAGGASRSYWLYLPPGSAHRPRPLVVFLHGCNETALQAAQATHFDALAARRDFVVVYPQQAVTAGTSAPLADGNGIGCWNWFLPEDQSRGAGEPALIAGITTTVAAEQHIDRTHVYVEGISAGADMAVILGATYPDVFRAVGVLAGCAYRACADATGELTHAAMGSRAREVPMFVENGTADTVNPAALAAGLVASWLGADDLADDGSPDGSVSRQPASEQTYAADQTPAPGSGDACVHNDSLTCPGGVVGFRGSYPYTVASWRDARGCEVLEFWAIHGLEHAHPDASGDGPYTDPLGPDVTTASYDFFARSTGPVQQRCTR
jgi:poly(hydroxyalkanoate) depolymerase family esterase